MEKSFTLDQVGHCLTAEIQQWGDIQVVCCLSHNSHSFSLTASHAYQNEIIESTLIDTHVLIVEALDFLIAFPRFVIIVFRFSLDMKRAVLENLG